MDIHVDWSLLIIFALITFDLGAVVFPSWHPQWTPATSWITAILAAALFFASVLAHELSHAIVAHKYGIPVHRITLFIFGGMAHMEEEPQSPKAELWMAIVGPLTSLAIGILALVLGSAFVREGALADPERAFLGLGPLPTLLLWLGPINIMLGVFNLIPGFPLDGGRVFRSLLWWKTGDLDKATRWASQVGQGFAWLLMALGVIRMFSGNFAGGLWLILIGWFLNNAARLSYVQLMQRQIFQQIPVSRVMRTRFERIPPDLSIEGLVHRHLIMFDQHAFLVEQDGVVLGLVTVDDVRKVPASAWATTPVSSIMTPAGELSGITSNVTADRAAEELAKRNVDHLPVVDGGRFLGLIERADLLKALALHHVLQRGMHHHAGAHA